MSVITKVESPSSFMKNYLTDAMADALRAPLPAEAVAPHPTKNYLSTIKAIYVVERLNDVFGVGGWQVKNKVIEAGEKMIVVKSVFTVPDHGIRVEAFGGNDNADRGDAYKGACTDALTKIGSYLYIGMDVFKGKGTPKQPAAQSGKPPSPKPQAPASKVGSPADPQAPLPSQAKPDKRHRMIEKIKILADSLEWDADALNKHASDRFKVKGGLYGLTDEQMEIYGSELKWSVEQIPLENAVV